MVVRLRLSRFGRKKCPFYRIIAADARSPRDGRFLEMLGTWAPEPDKYGSKYLRIQSQRIKYWISVGAQPTKIVSKLLAKADILPPPPLPPAHLKRPVKKPDKQAKSRAFSTVAAAASGSMPVPLTMPHTRVVSRTPAPTVALNGIRSYLHWIPFF